VGFGGFVDDLMDLNGAVPPALLTGRGFSSVAITGARGRCTSPA